MNKGKEYSHEDEDYLEIFKTAGKLQGISARRALAGMMAKHTVSIYDMCRHGKYPRSVWQEKITDHINYLLLLMAIVREEE